MRRVSSTGYASQSNNSLINRENNSRLENIGPSRRRSRPRADREALRELATETESTSLLGRNKDYLVTDTSASYSLGGAEVSVGAKCDGKSVYPYIKGSLALSAISGFGASITYSKNKPEKGWSASAKLQGLAAVDSSYNQKNLRYGNRESSSFGYGAPASVSVGVTYTGNPIDVEEEDEIVVETEYGAADCNCNDWS